MEKVKRRYKKRCVHGNVVEAVRVVVNEDNKDISMCLKGNDEGIVTMT